MPKRTLRNGMLVLLAVAASFSLLVQSASACDRDKLSRLASGIPLAANARTSTADSYKPAGDMQKPGQGMIGLWMVTDYYQDQIVDMYFDSWHADGNELFIDATNPAADNVCQGIWRQVTPTTFKLKHVSWTFDDTGTVNGTAIFHDVVTVSADGNSFNGNENVYIYDLNGDLVAEYDGDVLKATRIMVDF